MQRKEGIGVIRPTEKCRRTGRAANVPISPIKMERDLIDTMFERAIRSIGVGIYPRRIIRNGDATVVFWGDGNKTVVKCHGEGYDAEKGLAMALARKVWGRSETMRLVKSIEDQGAGR